MPPKVLANMLVVMNTIAALPHLKPSGSPAQNSLPQLPGEVSEPGRGSPNGGPRALLSDIVGSASFAGSRTGSAVGVASQYQVQRQDPGGCLAAVAAAVLQPHEIARIRRELDCAVREGDEARRRNVNEAVYLMQVQAGRTDGRDGINYL